MYNSVHMIARGVGHSTAAAKSGATVVCATMRQAKQLQRDNPGVKAISLTNCVAWVGKEEPLVFDVDAVQTMVSNMNGKIERLEMQLAEIHALTEVEQP